LSASVLPELSYGPTQTSEAVTDSASFGEDNDANIQSAADSVSTDAPAIGGFDATVFDPSDGSNVLLDANATLVGVDVTGPSPSVLTVTLLSNADSTDHLHLRTVTRLIGVSGSDITYRGTVIGSMTGGIGTDPLVITFNRQVSQSALQTVLRNVTYGSSAATGLSAPRIVGVTYTDSGGNTSILVTKVISTGQNNAPGDIALSSASVLENQAAGVQIGTLTTTDPDAGNVFTYALVSGDGSTDNGSFTIDSEGNLSSAVEFDIDRSYSIRIRSTDQEGLSVEKVFTITVTPVNDAPVVSGVEVAALAYSENDSATVISSSVTITDEDHTTLSGARVAITTNYQSGEDLLAFVNTVNITGTFDAVSGTLVLVGTDTVDAYIAALRSVTYQNLSDTPINLPRTVQFVVEDGIADSNTASRTIEVQPVNDAPTTIDTALTTDEGSAFAFGVSSFPFNDPDADDGLQTVTILSLPSAGFLTLDGEPVTVNQVIPASNLGLLAYTPAANESGPQYTTFTFQVGDGTLFSDSATMTVDVAMLEEAQRIRTVREAVLSLPSPDAVSSSATPLEQLQSLAAAKEVLAVNLGVLADAEEAINSLIASATSDYTLAMAEGVLLDVQTMTNLTNASFRATHDEFERIQNIVLHPADNLQWPVLPGVDLAVGMLPDSFAGAALSPDDAILYTTSGNVVSLRSVITGAVESTVVVNAPVLRGIAGASAGTFWALGPDSVMNLDAEGVERHRWNSDFSLSGLVASEDGSVVAVSSSRTVTILRLDGTNLIHSDITFPENVVVGMHFSPDGQYLAIPTETAVVLVDLGTMSQTQFTGFKTGYWVRSTAWSSDGTLLAAGDDFGLVQIIDVPTRQVIGSFQIPDNYSANTLVFSPNQAILFSGDNGTGLIGWDITNLNSINPYTTSTGKTGLHRFEASNSGNTILAYSDGKLLAYEVPLAGQGDPISRTAPPILNPIPPTPAATPDDPSWPQADKVDGTLGTVSVAGLTSLAVSPDGLSFVVADGSSVQIKTIATGLTTATFNIVGNVSAAALSANGESLIVVASDSQTNTTSVTVRNIVSGQIEFQWTHGGLVQSASIDAAHNLVVVVPMSGGGWKTVDISSGDVGSVLGSEVFVSRPVISDDGRFIAAGKVDGTIRLYDRTTGQTMTLIGLTQAITALTWSHGSSNILAAADANSNLALFTTASTQPLSRFFSPYDSDPTTGLAFSDNNLLLFRGAAVNGLLTFDVSNPGAPRVSTELPIIDLVGANNLVLSQSGKTLFTGAAGHVGSVFVTGISIPVYGQGTPNPDSPPPTSSPPPTIPPLDSSQQNELAAPTTIATLNATQSNYLLDVVTAWFTQKIVEGGNAGVPSTYLQNMQHNPALLGLTNDSTYEQFFSSLLLDLQTKSPLTNPPNLDAFAGGTGVHVVPSVTVVVPPPSTTIVTHRVLAELIAQATNPGVISTGILHSSAPSAIQSDYNESQTWYTGVGLTNGVVMDTAMARIFMGLLEQRSDAKPSGDWSAIQPMIETVSRLTGNPTGGLRFALLFSRDEDKAQERLHDLFVQWGYGHIFTGKSTATGSPIEPGNVPDVMISIRKAQYGPDETIRIALDFASRDAYDHASLYLFKNQQMIGATPFARLYGQTFVTIRASELGSLLPITLHGPTVLDWTVSIKVQTLDAVGNRLDDAFTGMVVIDAAPQYNLSTLPAGEDHDAENIVLSELARQKPFIPTDGNWVITIGSPAHDGSAFYAMDIGLPGPSADWGKDIRATSGGTIGPLSPASLNYGKITINHVTHGVQWSETYLHNILNLKMDASGNVVTKTIIDLSGTTRTVDVYTVSKLNSSLTVLETRGIWEGMTVSAGDVFSFIGGRGDFNDAEFFPHIHVEFRIGGGHAINIANVVERFWQIGVSGNDGLGSIASVKWNDSLQTPTQTGFWANDDQKLIFFRDHTITSNTENDVWLAWEGTDVGQMKKVVWNAGLSAWVELGVSTPSEKWHGGEWVAL